MKRLLAVQHIECEPLGLFQSGLSGNDFALEYVRTYTGEPLPEDLDGWDGVFFLGGPMAAYDDGGFPTARHEIELIKKGIEADKPVLGICLGSQLIARAAGAPVYAGQQKEIGWSTVSKTKAAENDPLFTGLPLTIPVFQWHGDTFDLPGGAVLLAGNKIYPNQAFRLKNNIYGLQFHVEVSLDMVQEWLREYQPELERERLDANAILANAAVKSSFLPPHGQPDNQQLPRAGEQQGRNRAGPGRLKNPHLPAQSHYRQNRQRACRSPDACHRNGGAAAFRQTRTGPFPSLPFALSPGFRGNLPDRQSDAQRPFFSRPLLLTSDCRLSGIHTPQSQCKHHTLSPEAF